MPQTQQQQSPNNLILRQKCSAAKRSKRAKSSLRSRISSSAVHWADNDVNPQISANNMLKRKKKMKKVQFVVKALYIVYNYSSNRKLASHSPSNQIQMKSWILSKRLFRPSILMSKGSEKLEMKILLHGKQELPANQCRPICPWLADLLALVS